METNITKIYPYKQNYYESCLIACALMVTGVSRNYKKSETLEKNIFFEAERKNFQFNIQSKVYSISKYLNAKVKLFADNKYFTDKLMKDFKSKDVYIVQQKVNSANIKKLFFEIGYLICFIDGHYLGDYSHWPHYVVIEKINGDKITIIDPNTSKRKFLSLKQMDDAIGGLRETLKMCPLLLSIKL